MNTIELARKYGLEDGLQQGLQQGLQKGRLEERRKAEKEKMGLAREMNKSDISVEQISKFLNLSKEEIDRL